MRDNMRIGRTSWQSGAAAAVAICAAVLLSSCGKGNDPEVSAGQESTTLLLAKLTNAVPVPAGSGLQSLKSISVPAPDSAVIGEFIANKNAAIALGKALFWEMRVGSDNKTACASCHFQAGADNRITNQINPGLLANNTSFEIGAPNYTFINDDFPLLLAINDVASSQGVFNTEFTRTGTAGSEDVCANVADDVFHITGANTRRVEPRNTPSVINAAYNFRNFWDGRANNIFNGGDPFGMRNEEFSVMKWERGQFIPTMVRLPSSSLASQASGPPLSGFEMSCKNRSFVNVAQKLLERPILSLQEIAADDSVLGGYSKNRPTYASLIRNAFQPAYWMATVPVRFPRGVLPRVESMDLRDAPVLSNRPAPTDLSQMQANFSLFFGLALQMYQSTLIANDTPYDRHAEGRGGLNAQQLRGLQVFNGQGRCVNCHSGAEFTNASFRNVLNQRLERMPMSSGVQAVYDNGFYNIGVRPTGEDRGVGGVDPFGKPLSETRMVQAGLAAQLGNGFNTAKEPAVAAGDRVAVEGAFKTPGLRNVELTGPYFHNGGKSTLMQVVDFYNRGGDFPDQNRADLAPDITPLGLDDGQKADLVAFMLGLTDERVRLKRAPFDHPSLCLPHGHTAAVAGSSTMPDAMECLPAVGAGGVGAANALQPFLRLSPFSPGPVRQPAP